MSKQDDSHPSSMGMDSDIGCNFAEMVEAHRKEEEEKERIKERERRGQENPKAAVSQRLNARPGRRKILKRTRTVKDADGGESIFVDYIRDPKQILLYLDEQILPPPPVTPLGSIGFGGQRRKILRKAAPVKKKVEGKEKEGEKGGEGEGGGEGEEFGEGEGSDADVSGDERGEEERPIALMEKREAGTVLVIRKKEEASQSSGSASRSSAAPIKLRLAPPSAVPPSPSPSHSPFAAPSSASTPKPEKKKKKKKAKVKAIVQPPKDDVTLSPATPPLPPSSFPSSSPSFSPAVVAGNVPKIKLKLSQTSLQEMEKGAKKEGGGEKEREKEGEKKKVKSAKKRKRREEERPQISASKKPKTEAPSSSHLPSSSPLPSSSSSLSSSSTPLSSSSLPPPFPPSKPVVDHKELGRLREERRSKFMAIVQSLYSLDQFIAFK